MVYLEPSVLRSSDHFESWLNTLLPKLKNENDEPVNPEFTKRLRDLFNIVFPTAVNFVIDQCSTII
jgi:hypothetical protein